LAALASAPAKCSVCGYAEVDCRARKPMTCFGRGGDDLASAPAGDGVIAVVIELARRDIAREQTDFLGRMAQSLCTYEGIFADYPDGDLPEDVRDEAEDEISALAGLALAQLVLLRHPSDGTDPAAALARPHFCGARQ
ncbi:hypothetical protein, partial [Sphingomonas sp. T9W2]|uniref:hypothetical protein n=1 Tax=Sphingomonas sp. T9W2 TaxID=3143183 RepID=UPI0031F4951E